MNKSVKKYLVLHATILLYSLTTILTKLASGYEFLSFTYIVFMGLMVLNLMVYAVFWQQAIKPFKPSVAYSNKSVTTIWTLILSACLFGESITFKNIIGAALIIFGVIMVVNSDD